MTTEPLRDYLAMEVNSKQYKLALDYNALANMEEQNPGCNGLELITMSGPPFSSARLLVYYALQKYHADEFLTRDSAGTLLLDYLRVKGHSLSTLSDCIHAAMAASGFAAFAKEEAAGPNEVPPPVE